MHAEVMAIGDELTSGERLDTNSQWLSQQLATIGVPVLYHTTVGDDLPALTAAVQTAIQRSPLVVMTGGLGPTADDLTRQAVSQATDLPLELRHEQLQIIQSRFAHRGRQMPAQNRVQAMFPRGSRIIANPHGTAPGIDLQCTYDGASSRLFALPGVPAEMIEMWEQSVQPAIVALAGLRQVICHRRLKCFGVGESQLESMLPDLIRRDRQPRVGITVHRATITLRVTAAGPDEESCHALMEPTLQTIRQCLGGLVFGEEEEELEHAVLRLLRQRGQRLAICEWGTGGLLSRWLSSALCAETLHAALVVSGHAALQDLFVSAPPAADQSELLRWIVGQLRRRFPVEYALAIGPLPDPDHPDPRIYLGLSSPRGVVVVDRAYRGHPDVVLERAAKQALDLLRHELSSDHADVAPTPLPASPRTSPLP